MTADIHRIGSAFVTGGSGFVGRNLLRALVARSIPVRALARSDAAAAVVEALGAEPVRGDLLDVAAIEAGAAGRDTVFHCAAFVDDWDVDGTADRLNIHGTRLVLGAAERAGAGAVVHVSTEAVLVGGPPLVDADETWPLPERPLGPYARTKGQAEREVQSFVSGGLRALIVRPRFVWGNDDSTLLPRLVEATEQGVLRWVDGGRYLTSRCHVDNCVEGMLLAAERGRAGEAYFLTDGPPIPFRTFVSDLLHTQGVSPPTGTAPRWAMAALARACEAAWSLPLPGRPPLTRSAVRIIGQTVTVSDAKARRELGYVGTVSLDQGMADLRTRAGA